VPAELFEENCDIFEQSDCHVVDWGSQLCRRTNPNVDAKVDFIPTFADGMRKISFSDSTVVDDEHTLTYKTCFACLQNFV